MKLFYTPGACSLAVHIALLEAGLTFDLEKVDLRQKKTELGEDFYGINPKGAVPVLALDDGPVLTEGAAILQYVADLVPEKELAPRLGTFERYRLIEWLSYVSTDIHKSFSPLFDATTSGETKTATRSKIGKRLDYTNSALASRNYLLGDSFTVADAYLFVMLSWCAPTGIGLSPWPTLGAYHKRIAERAAVKAARVAEGLVSA